jgi:hypothetical protein
MHASLSCMSTKKIHYYELELLTPSSEYLHLFGKRAQFTLNHHLHCFFPTFFLNFSFFISLCISIFFYFHSFLTLLEFEFLYLYILFFNFLFSINISISLFVFCSMFLFWHFERVRQLMCCFAAGRMTVVNCIRL